MAGDFHRKRLMPRSYFCWSYYDETAIDESLVTCVLPLPSFPPLLYDVPSCLPTLAQATISPRLGCEEAFCGGNSLCGGVRHYHDIYKTPRRIDACRRLEIGRVHG